MSSEVSRAYKQELLVGGRKRVRRVRKAKPMVAKPKRVRHKRQSGGLHPLLLAAAAPLAASLGKAALGVLDTVTNKIEPIRRFRKWIGLGRVRKPAKPKAKRVGRGFALPGRSTQLMHKLPTNKVIVRMQAVAKPAARQMANVMHPPMVGSGRAKPVQKKLNSLYVQKPPKLLTPY